MFCNYFYIPEFTGFKCDSLKDLRITKEKLLSEGYAVCIRVKKTCYVITGEKWI